MAAINCCYMLEGISSFMALISQCNTFAQSFEGRTWDVDDLACDEPTPRGKTSLLRIHGMINCMSFTFLFLMPVRLLFDNSMLFSDSSSVVVVVDEAESVVSDCTPLSTLGWWVAYLSVTVHVYWRINNFTACLSCNTQSQCTSAQGSRFWGNLWQTSFHLCLKRILHGKCFNSMETFLGVYSLQYLFLFYIL